MSPNLPDDSLILLLPDIARNFAVDLASAQGHSQGLRHIFLYRGRNIRVLVCRPNPDLSRPLVLKLAGGELRKVRAANERKDYIGRETSFDCGFEAERVGGVDKNASVLGGNDRIDDRGEVVDIGKRFYTEYDVVKCAFFASGCFFRCPYDYITSLFSKSARPSWVRESERKGAHTMPRLEPLIAKDGGSRR